MLAARRVLLDALGPDKERRYTPHLTLTMRLDKGETQARLKELRQSEWQSGHWVVPLDHLWLMQRGPDDRAWRYIYRVSLKRSIHCQLMSRCIRCIEYNISSGGIWN